MGDVTITINGRHYEIGCDPGQEGRIVDLAAYIDQKLQTIARAGAAYNDSHLLVLTALVLADELFESKEAKPRARSAARSEEDEARLAELLAHITERIEGIAAKVQAA